jgi:hypothetical protein
MEHEGTAKTNAPGLKFVCLIFVSSVWKISTIKLEVQSKVHLSARARVVQQDRNGAVIADAKGVTATHMDYGGVCPLPGHRT